MADKSSIEWTDATWNIITGCTLVDEGCRNCYAAHLIASWPAIGNHPSRKGLARKNAAGGAKFTGEVRFNEQWLDQPLRWKKARRIFVCAHGDLFHEAVPDEWIDRVFAVMALAPQHTFQCLTKRPDRAREYLLSKWDLEGGGVMSRGNVIANAALVMDTARFMGGGKMLKGWPLPNVWLGTSASDQASADLRIPPLLAAPAAVRFLSAEPLLGAMDLRAYLPGCYECGGGCNTRLARHPSTDRCVPCQAEYGQGSGPLELCPACGSSEWEPVCPECNHYMVQHHPDTPCLDLVIVGGESGPRARPMHPDWARSLRDQCNAAGVAFFFKQIGEWTAWEEFGSLPLFRNPYTLAEEDRHNLFPADWDNAPSWDDGLRFVDTNRHVAFHRAGKARAGRMLDGRTWDQMPGVADA